MGAPDMLSEHLPMLYRVAWMLTGNEADAEDLAHDTMVAALSSIGRFRAESRLSTWLTAILVNRHRAIKRRSGYARPELPVSAPSEPGAAMAAEEEKAALLRALDRLTEDERTLVALSAYQGLDSSEIGDMLGRPAGTIRYQLHEAREKLRAMLLEKRHG